jgi:hypothetical protein
MLDDSNVTLSFTCFKVKLLNFDILSNNFYLFMDSIYTKTEAKQFPCLAMALVRNLNLLKYF